MQLKDINPIYRVVFHLRAGQTIELLMESRPEIDLVTSIKLQGYDPGQSPEVKSKEISIQANDISAYEIIDDPIGV